MDASLTIIDDFYNDPDSVRDIALSCNYYSEKVSKGYPTGNAPWSGTMSKDAYSPSWIDTVVSKHLNKNLRQMRQLDSGHFRISKETNVVGMFDNLLHFDRHEEIYYAGVLYLSKDKHTTPGTLFYRHKETGVYKAPAEIDRTEFNDSSKWDIHTTSNVVYNRLIIYPASQFHGPGPCFGNTDDNARIVQLFNWIDIK